MVPYFIDSKKKSKSGRLYLADPSGKVERPRCRKPQLLFDIFGGIGNILKPPSGDDSERTRYFRPIFKLIIVTKMNFSKEDYVFINHISTILCHYFHNNYISSLVSICVSLLFSKDADTLTRQNSDSIQNILILM